jgi:hypothetical protein
VNRQGSMYKRRRDRLCEVGCSECEKEMKCRVKRNRAEA